MLERTENFKELTDVPISLIEIGRVAAVDSASLDPATRDTNKLLINVRRVKTLFK